MNPLRAVCPSDTSDELFRPILGVGLPTALSTATTTQPSRALNLNVRKILDTTSGRLDSYIQLLEQDTGLWQQLSKLYKSQARVTQLFAVLQALSSLFIVACSQQETEQLQKEKLQTQIHQYEQARLEQSLLFTYMDEKTARIVQDLMSKSLQTIRAEFGEKTPSQASVDDMQRVCQLIAQTLLREGFSYEPIETFAQGVHKKKLDCDTAVFIYVQVADILKLPFVYVEGFRTETTNQGHSWLEVQTSNGGFDWETTAAFGVTASISDALENAILQVCKRELGKIRQEYPFRITAFHSTQALYYYSHSQELAAHLVRLGILDADEFTFRYKTYEDLQTVERYILQDKEKIAKMGFSKIFRILYLSYCNSQTIQFLPSTYAQRVEYINQRMNFLMQLHPVNDARVNGWLTRELAFLTRLQRYIIQNPHMPILITARGWETNPEKLWDDIGVRIVEKDGFDHLVANTLAQLEAYEKKYIAYVSQFPRGILPRYVLIPYGNQFRAEPMREALLQENYEQYVKNRISFLQSIKPWFNSAGCEYIDRLLATF